MNKNEMIKKLVEETSLSSSDAIKLVEERISMLANEEARKKVEIKLKRIEHILSLYTGE